MKKVKIEPRNNITDTNNINNYIIQDTISILDKNQSQLNQQYSKYRDPYTQKQGWVIKTVPIKLQKHLQIRVLWIQRDKQSKKWVIHQDYTGGRNFESASFQTFDKAVQAAINWKAHIDKLIQRNSGKIVINQSKREIPIQNSLQQKIPIQKSLQQKIPIQNSTQQKIPRQKLNKPTKRTNINKKLIIMKKTRPNFEQKVIIQKGISNKQKKFMRQMFKSAQSPNTILPKTFMYNFLRQMNKQMNKDYRFSKKAVQALIRSAQAYYISFIQNSAQLTRSTGRKTLMQSDMKLAYKLQNGTYPIWK